jgi:signal peptidase I
MTGVHFRAAPVDPRASTGAARVPRRRVRVVAWALLGLVVASWLVFLRPTFLGGPTSYVVVSGQSMQPTLADNDLVLLRRQTTYAVGDIVAYHVPPGTGPDIRVIHRIVGGSAGDGFVTRGDNRGLDDPWHPTPHDIVGRESLRIPRAGYVLSALKSPVGLAAIAIALGLSLLWSAHASRRDASPARTRRAHVPPAAAVAARIRARYLTEADPRARHGMRLVAFELALAYAGVDPGFDKDAFLRACGIGADGSAPDPRPSRSGQAPPAQPPPPGSTR